MSALRRLALAVVMASFSGPSAPDWVRRAIDDGLGGVCLFGSNVPTTGDLGALCSALHARRPDVLLCTDEEGGDVTRLHLRTGSPQPGNAALGVVDDLALTTAVAQEIGADLREAGIDLDLAPVVDVNSNPDNPVIGVRSFGADPHLVARHTTAYVAGLHSAGVGACVKHFPGHGDTSVDSHLGLPAVTASRGELERRELLPFRAAVEAGAVAVMSAHVLLPSIDPELPATLSAPAVALLRDDLGFDGLLVSDALDMRGASMGRGVPAAAVLALRAGCDLLCLGAEKDGDDLASVIDAVVTAVDGGELTEQRLGSAAARVAAAVARTADLRAAAPASSQGTASRDVAARALQVSGPLPMTRGATVVRFVTASNAAVGQLPWGLPPDGQVRRGGRQVDVFSTAGIAPAVRDGAGTPLVLLVRDAHRHPWVVAGLQDVARARPDAVVVEFGWPGSQPANGLAAVRTYGASPALARAADDLLAAGTSADGTALPP